MAPLLALIGFTAAAAQVVLLRELLVVAGGNEIALGTALAAWLLWTAAGSALGARLRAGLPALQVAAALALPLTLAAIRSSRALFHAPGGEALGPVPMFLISCGSLSVFCLLSGAMFPAGMRLGGSAGRVYLLEALGSAGGGALAGLAVVPLGSAGVLCGISALNLAAAAYLTKRKMLFAAAAVVPFVAPWLHTATLARLWQGLPLEAVRESRFASLAVVRTEDTRTLYENGLPAFTVPDPAAAEEAVHYGLLQHPSPRTVLLAGGGAEACEQARRHPGVQQVDYVELDPAILDLFPVPGTVHQADLRVYLARPGPRFDVILLNLPDPDTARLNRFYTVEFFRQAAARLAPGGVLALRLTGSENYLGPAAAALARSIVKTLREVFPETLAMPGGTLRLFATLQPGTLLRDPAALVARLRARGLQTTYVREYYLPFQMSPDRMQDLDRQIRPDAATPVNRDFAPAACRLAAARWSARWGAPWFLKALLSASGLLLALCLAARGARARVAAMGFTLMGLQILLLLGFDAIHGYLYGQLALLLAGSMAGMALGSWWSLRRAQPPRLAPLQWMAAAAAPALCTLMPFTPAALFPVLAAACGALGGCQFAAATRLSKTSGAALYAADLAGACAAALLVSAWTIPHYGFWWTAAAMAGVNLLAR